VTSGGLAVARSFPGSRVHSLQAAFIPGAGLVPRGPGWLPGAAGHVWGCSAPGVCVRSARAARYRSLRGSTTSTAPRMSTEQGVESSCTNPSPMSPSGSTSRVSDDARLDSGGVRRERVSEAVGWCFQCVSGVFRRGTSPGVTPRRRFRSGSGAGGIPSSRLPQRKCTRSGAEEPGRCLRRPSRRGGVSDSV